MKNLYRSLFVKIFLWFWLAMTLVVAAFTVSVIILHKPSRPPRPETLIFRLLEATGRVSLETLTEKGPEEVKQAANEELSPPETKLSIYSDQHPELSVDQAPEAVRRLVKKTKQDYSPHRAKTEDFRYYAKQVRSDKGSVVVVIEIPEFQHPLEGIENPGRLAQHILAVVLVGGLVCYWLARSITSPLRHLIAATRQLAKGDLHVQVGQKLLKRGDELAELGQAFDRMASELDKMVTTQKRLLQDVSHELRSPLARLNVALALARQKASTEATDALDRIEREAERLNRLIGQLLTLARFDSTPEELRTEVNLESILETIVQDAQFEADSRHISVRILESQRCTILGHYDMLYAAFENIIRNAICYTTEDTSVDIRLEASENPKNGSTEIKISVRDHGPGIPESELEKILQPFYTVDSSLYPADTKRSVSSGRTGLGLSIVDRVITQLDGRIHLSNVPGGGLLFEVYLPQSETL